MRTLMLSAIFLIGISTVAAADITCGTATAGADTVTVCVDGCSVFATYKDNGQVPVGWRVVITDMRDIGVHNESETLPWPSLVYIDIVWDQKTWAIELTGEYISDCSLVTGTDTRTLESVKMEYR